MELLNNQTTLVDQVEDRLLAYFKENNLKCGDGIPQENNLAMDLGVARSVLREALSRLKMMGLISTRPRRGMILTEPSILGGMRKIINPAIMSEESIFDILGFRIALEIGISGDIFRNITSRDIQELNEIVNMEVVMEHNEYTIKSELSFHTKLYEITGNKTISQFQKIIYPIMDFVKIKFKDYLMPINVEMSKKNMLVTHADLLDFIRKNDEPGYKEAIERHFEVYKIFMRKRTNE